MGNRIMPIWGGGMRFLLVLCLASLIILTLFACSGCGGSEEGAVEEHENEQVETEDDENRTQEADTSQEEYQAEEDEASISGGGSDFELEPQEIGAGAHLSDLRITDIRWADHGEYFRIVFELECSDGSEVTEVPNCHTWYTGFGHPEHEKLYELFVSFDDILNYRFDYAPFAAADTPVSLGDPLVETIKRLSWADTEPVCFEVECAHSDAHPGVSSRPHRLMYQTHPMRVIMDIQRM